MWHQRYYCKDWNQIPCLSQDNSYTWLHVLLECTHLVLDYHEFLKGHKLIHWHIFQWLHFFVATWIPTSIVKGGNSIFDVGILHLAGVPQDLYRVSDYALDVLVLQLCSSSTRNKLLDLLLKSHEDPLNISLMAITL